MGPVLMVPVLVPVCQHAVAATVFRCQPPIQMCYTALGAIGEISTPDKEGWPGRLTKKADQDAWQRRLTRTPDKEGWPGRLTKKADQDAWQRRLTRTPDKEGWPGRLTKKADKDAWQRRLTRTPDKEGWPGRLTKKADQDARTRRMIPHNCGQCIFTIELDSACPLLPFLVSHMDDILILYII